MRGRDVIGMRFGRLLVMSQAASLGTHRAFHVRCDCGTTKVIRYSDMNSGATVSCGCAHSERASALGRTKAIHKLTGTSTYRTWRAMRERCGVPTHHRFSHYGGRGIKVCDRWMDFAKFLEDMGPRPVGTSLDRIDNDGNYELGNCRWATRQEQARNRSTNLVIALNGEKKCLAEWCDELGLPRARVLARIRTLGWSPERALSEMGDARTRKTGAPA